MAAGKNEEEKIEKGGKIGENGIKNGKRLFFKL